MFAALGRLASRRPWYIIAAWVVLTVLVTAFHPSIKATTDQADFLPDKYDSIRAYSLIADAFGDEANASGGATILFDHEDGSALSAADLAKVQQIAAGLKPGSAFGAAEKNGSGATPLVQLPGDGKQRAGLVTLDLAPGVTGQDQSDMDQVKTLRSDLDDATEGTGLRAQVGGTLAQNYDQSQSGGNAEKLVVLATVLLLIILLGVIFRSVLVTLLPLITVIFFLAPLSAGLDNYAAKLFGLQKDDSTAVIIDIVLFGIGTDYILFFLFRYRERMRSHRVAATDRAARVAEHRSAVEYAVTRAGEATASAGGAVFIAFMTLALSTLGMFKSMGPNLAIAVAVTVLAALTLVPALTSVFGRALFWPSKKWRNEPKEAGFGRVGDALGKHPARFALVSGGVLVVLAVFALGFNPTFDLTSANASQSTESAKVDTLKVDRGFSAGAGTPTILVLHSKDDKPLTPAEITSFYGAISKIKGISLGGAAAATGGDAAAALSQIPSTPTLPVTVNLDNDPASDAALAFVKDTLRPEVDAAAPEGTEALVTGITAVFVDFKSAMNRDYLVVFPVAAAITILILMLVLRSLVAPWYLMVSVALGFAATLGAATLTFQDIGGQSGLIFMLPLLVYLFVVALGTDYNILMVTRLREEAQEGKGPREAAAWAVRHAGPTVAAAGLILAGTFASLMFGGNSFLVTLGFAISFGIALAAFVMALFFTPAITALVGHAAWWPGHGDEAAPERDHATH
ncbi:MMPL family transporter [Nocardioides sp. Kera G14]|uniref:MMPL family transporter n=1 Tax=Nocardioides sp. Kera G14 TaxID=2884264 RepID=UPI001D0F7B76|nr:MMPL family transporter [Nocardioides sp. Kera G14]UDY24318.1 MMPL family transporter [Nocardioides sp. Kera G14]